MLYGTECHNQKVRFFPFARLMYGHKTGFTLIELLVVIAIIAILAAILFPVFLTAKEKGRGSTCKSNMKQIATSIQMYLDDWGGCYPDQTSVGIAYKEPYDNGLGGSWITGFSHRYRSDPPTGGIPGPGGMTVPLKPYMKNLAIFKCPGEWNDALKKKYSGIIWLPYTTGSSYYFKHALNYYANCYKRPIKQSDVTYPTRVSLLYEESWHYCKENPLLWNQPNNFPSKRVGAVFIDGHVGTIDIPWNPGSGYDGNWYYYDKDHGPKNPQNCWDVSQGARDRY